MAAMQQTELPLATRRNAPMGLDARPTDVDARDIVIPHLKLLQPTSDEITNPTDEDVQYLPGTFINTLTSVVYGRGFNMVPLGMLKNRRYFEGRELLCRSDNMHTGVGTPGGSCSACTLRQWQNRRPPKCREAIVMPVAILPQDDGEDLFDIALMTFAKTNLRTGQRVLSTTLQRNTPFSDLLWSVSSRSRQNDQGRWFVADAKLGGPTPDETKDRLAEILSTFDLSAAVNSADEVVVGTQENRAQPGAATCYAGIGTCCR